MGDFRKFVFIIVFIIVNTREHNASKVSVYVRYREWWKGHLASPIVRRGDLVVKNRLRLPKSRTYTRLCHRADVFCVRRARVFGSCGSESSSFSWSSWKVTGCNEEEIEVDGVFSERFAEVEDHILHVKREDQILRSVYFSIRRASAIFIHSRPILHSRIVSIRVIVVEFRAHDRLIRHLRRFILPEKRRS